MAANPATNAWRWRWNFFGTAFGEHAPTVPASGALALDLRYPGQAYDAETGLHYNYFRDYEPVTGRFVESDPLGLEAGNSTYSYVNSMPLSYMDPDGREQLCGMKFCRSTAPIVPPPDLRNRECRTFISMASWFWNVNWNLPDWKITTDDNFLPEVGFTLVRCCKPESCAINDEPIATLFGKKYKNFSAGVGRRLGLSFGNDEEICVNLGFGIGLPANVGN